MTQTTSATGALKSSALEQVSFSINNLRNFIERLERLEEQKEDFMSDIREVYKEANMQGFDASTMRKVIKLRKADTKKLEEQEQLLDLYKNALGM